LIVGNIDAPIAVTKVERSKNSKLALVAERFITAVRNVKWSTGKLAIKLTATRVIG
jgi:hypothetical protein